MRRAEIIGRGPSRFWFRQISTAIFAAMMAFHVPSASAATPATAGVFVPHAVPPTAHRQSHATTILADGTVLITGGLDNSNVAQNTAAIYNPATGLTTILLQTPP